MHQQSPAKVDAKLINRPKVLSMSNTALSTPKAATSNSPTKQNTPTPSKTQKTASPSIQRQAALPANQLSSNIQMKTPFQGTLGGPRKVMDLKPVVSGHPILSHSKASKVIRSQHIPEPEVKAIKLDTEMLKTKVEVSKDSKVEVSKKQVTVRRKQSMDGNTHLPLVTAKPTVNTIKKPQFNTNPTTIQSKKPASILSKPIAVLKPKLDSKLIKKQDNTSKTQIPSFIQRNKTAIKTKSQLNLINDTKLEEKSKPSEENNVSNTLAIDKMTIIAPPTPILDPKYDQSDDFRIIARALELFKLSDEYKRNFETQSAGNEVNLDIKIQANFADSGPTTNETDLETIQCFIQSLIENVVSQSMIETVRPKETDTNNEIELKSIENSMDDIELEVESIQEYNESIILDEGSVIIEVDESVIIESEKINTVDYSPLSLVDSEIQLLDDIREVDIIDETPTPSSPSSPKQFMKKTFTSIDTLIELDDDDFTNQKLEDVVVLLDSCDSRIRMNAFLLCKGKEDLVRELLKNDILVDLKIQIMEAL